MTPAELDGLLERGPQLHLQPVVDLARGTVAGYEALARFPGTPGPLPVFDAARSAGRTAEFEAAALRRALEAHEELPANTFLTVNVGPDVIDTPIVREIWRDHPSLGGVVLELTEQARIESYVALEPVLDRLRSQGALVAVDDAGAGYAGLQHLLGLRPDFIKLDRELVACVDTDEAKRALVEMVGTFASRVDAWLIAEGVETQGELDVLLDLRVPLAQGYYLATPRPGFMTLEPDITARIARRSRRSPGATLRALLETTVVLSPTSTEDLLEVLGQGDVAVVVDGNGRPQATVDREGMAHAVRDSGLRVNLDTALDEAAQRAIVRTPEVRFHPLVCTDAAGRYVGIVRMERLIEALARQT